MSDNKIEPKIDKIIEDLGEVKTHLAVYNEQLKVHIKGVQTLDKRLKPVETHVLFVNTALKLLGSVAAIMGIIELLKKLV